RFFGKKKDKSKSIKNLSSIEDDLPERHSSFIDGRRYGEEYLSECYRSKRGKKMGKGAKSCPIGEMSSPVTSRGHSSKSRHRSISDDSDETMQMNTSERIREKLLRAEEERLEKKGKCERFNRRWKEWRRHARSEACAQRIEMDDLIEENHKLKRENEEMKAAILIQRDIVGLKREISQLTLQQPQYLPTQPHGYSLFPANPPQLSSFLSNTPADSEGRTPRNVRYEDSDNFERQYDSSLDSVLNDD
ncbi:hypothetical protein PMAYCL1PPCAC_07712, partial [Pristionchus mayeri]